MVENEVMNRILKDMYTKVDIVKEESGVIRFITGLVDKNVKTAILDKKHNILSIYSDGVCLRNIIIENANANV